MKAKISVIVPVHNTEPFLERCIDSILSQTFSDFELILVNNGSIDHSGNICDRYAENNERVTVIHQVDRGSAGGRNTGIEYALRHSQSEWIAFIDSDDWVSPIYLEALLDVAEQNGIGICGYKKTVEYEEGSTSYPLKQITIKTEDFYCYKMVNTVVPWGKLYKKDCFCDVRFPEGKAHEDEFVTYKILFGYDQLTFIDEPLYLYFFNPTGVINSEWTPKEMDKLEAISEQIAFFKERSLQKAYTRAIAYYYSTVRSFMKQAKNNHYEQEVIKLKKLNKKHILCYGFHLLKYRLHKG